MKYTIQNGVEHRFSDRVSFNTRFILPLLVILAGVLFFVLNPYHFSKVAPKPFTLGIYTVKTPNGSSSDNNKNSTNGDNGSSNLNGSGQISTINPQQGLAGTSMSSTSNFVSTGGLGGGSAPTTTAPSVTPSLSPIVTTSVATTGCTIGTVATPSVCGTCTSPITLVGAQKSILTTTGECIAVDP